MTTTRNTPEQTIGGIPVSAPLFRYTPYMTLIGIVQQLSNASYHYADDSGGEWGRAALSKMEAASIINNCELGFSAIEALYKEKPQLLSFEALIDAVLKDARK